MRVSFLLRVAANSALEYYPFAYHSSGLFLPLNFNKRIDERMNNTVYFYQMICDIVFLLVFLKTLPLQYYYPGVFHLCFTIMISLFSHIVICPGAFTIDNNQRI